MNFQKNAPPMVRKDDVKNIQLNHLLTGKITLIGERKTPSGINKQTVNRKLFLGKEGFEGDEQGDKKHHGGPDKAIHHYPFEHYALWMKEIAANSILSSPGAFGENFSTTGLDETNVAPGGGEVSSYLGSELDFTLDFTPTENIIFSTTVGYFLPGGACDGNGAFESDDSFGVTTRLGINF